MGAHTPEGNRGPRDRVPRGERTAPADPAGGEPRGPTGPRHGPLPTPRGVGTRGVSPAPPRGRGGCGGVPTGSAHARPTPTGHRGQPPLPPPAPPRPPPPTATRPPRPPSPRDISILSRFSLLRAFGGGGGVAVAPTSRAPNRFMAGDAAAASEAGSREGRSRRPSSASHSRTQTSCSAERARAPPASSPSHPRRREGRGGGGYRDEPTARAAHAELAPSGPCRPGAPPLRSRSLDRPPPPRGSRCPSAGTFRTSGRGWTPAPPKPSLKHLAWPCCVLGGGGGVGGLLLRKGSARPSAMQPPEAGQTPP